jgi:hypothetical protein
MLFELRKFAQKNLFLRKLLGYHLASSGFFDKVIINYKLSDIWQKRIQDVLSCPDNEYIARVKNAGEISHGKQTMHNGLKIHLGSYYGPEYSKMLQLNKGVHEPQEERVFQEVLKAIPPGSTMIEMGSFWCFYSMWFNLKVKGAKNYMIEPDNFNMGHGKRNFKLNKMSGTFVQAFIGKESKTDEHVQTVAVDDFVEKNGISFVEMLHSDIQGYEFDMLLGTQRCFEKHKIGYVFISTHSNDIHYKCLDFLKKFEFVILAGADLDQTFSEDGLLAARAPYYQGIESIEIALKKK